MFIKFWTYYHVVARKGNVNDLMKVMNKYAQGKASTISLVNNLIDFFFEDRKEIDIPLHFVNEAILHKNPRLFVKNFVRYELKNKKRKKR